MVANEHAQHCNLHLPHSADFRSGELAMPRPLAERVLTIFDHLVGILTLGGQHSNNSGRATPDL